MEVTPTVNGEAVAKGEAEGGSQGAWYLRLRLGARLCRFVRSMIVRSFDSVSVWLRSRILLFLLLVSDLVLGRIPVTRDL